MFVLKPPKLGQLLFYFYFTCRVELDLKTKRVAYLISHIAYVAYAFVAGLCGHFAFVAYALGAGLCGHCFWDLGGFFGPP